jgi:hypothetical protein
MNQTASFCVLGTILLFCLREGCSFDRIDHVYNFEVFLVFLAGLENVRGHGAGAHPFPRGGGVRILRIVLHLVARGYIGGEEIVPFDAAEAGEIGIVPFDDSGVEQLFAVRIGGRFRQGPAGLRQLGAFQNKHGGPEQDGGRRLGIVEDGEEGFQGAVAELVEVVAAGEDECGAGAA